MSYLSITPSQTDADSPVDQTFTDTIRTDLDDLDSRVSSLFALGTSGVMDDFMGLNGVAPDTNAWKAVTGGAGAPSVLTNASSQHALELISGSGGWGFARVTDGKIHLDVKQDYSAIVEFRVKATTLGATVLLGIQDATLGDVVGRISTTTNMIGLIKGTGATFKFRTANAGTATETDGLGTPGSWQVWRFTLTCAVSSGSRQVKVEVGSSVSTLSQISGSPFTTNFPLMQLSPSFGVSGATSDSDILLDYVLAYTTSRPLSA